jgi:endoglucanase
MNFFSRQWRERGSIGSVYGHDGTIIDGAESPAIYGGVLGYFMVADPDAARDLYEAKIQYLWNPNTNTWRERLSYYDDNWAWFGFGLYHNLLPNLYESLPPEAFER